MLLHILETCISSQAQKKKRLFIIKSQIRQINFLNSFYHRLKISTNVMIEKFVSKGLKSSQDENRDERRAKRKK